MKKIMKFNLVFKALLVCIIIILVASCDKDFNTVGSNIVGDEHYGLNHDSISVRAYSQNTDPVQTNYLPVNSLGFYNNSVFGKTTASFVTQVQLGTYAPTFYDNPSSIVVDSVYLYVPYYTKWLSVDSDGNNSYELDSIQGKNNKIKLSIYKSNYYLNSNDPSSGFINPQIYYNDMQPAIDAAKADLLYTNDAFPFDGNEIKLLKNVGTSTEALKTRLAPGLFVNFVGPAKDFFKNQIINGSSDNLLNSTNFINYFRGLYFKAEPSSTSPTQGGLAQMNFGAGKITIVYRDHTSTTDTNPVSRQTLVMNLGSYGVNLVNNEPTSTYNPFYTAVSAVNSERLYLKGGQGSVAALDLFDDIDDIKYDSTIGKLVSGHNGVPDQLDKLRHPDDGKPILINDASISFNIDKTAMGTEAEPNRIYLYDINNKRPIIDYYLDNTTGLTPKYNKATFGGIIEKDASGRGVRYKVKITNYLRNLVMHDSTNVKLGLSVTESIGTVSNAYLKNPFTYYLYDTNHMPQSHISKYIPIMSVCNPLGTVIYGTGTTTPTLPEGKKIKLHYWYTKPE